MRLGFDSDGDKWSRIWVILITFFHITYNANKKNFELEKGKFFLILLDGEKISIINKKKL